MSTGVIRSAVLCEQKHVFDGEWFGHPAARIAREQLHGVAAGVFRDDQRVVNFLDRSMKPIRGRFISS